MSKGIWMAIGAYSTWGFFPIYWKALRHVPATQVLGHRIIWSCLFLLLVLFATRHWREFRAALTPPALRAAAIAGVMISLNWLTYVWAVAAGHIVQTSLGYFISPLFSVLLGVFFLKERLRPGQWMSVILAAAGVLTLTWIQGALPWVALVLAGTFALYGLVKKTSPLGSIHGMVAETGLMLPPALLYLLALQVAGQGAILQDDPGTDLLLVGGGVVTSIPLLLFAGAARRIPLSLTGILQYISPSVQLLIGVLVYRESFGASQFAGFALVWTGLILFVADGWITTRRGSRMAPPVCA